MQQVKELLAKLTERRKAIEDQVAPLRAKRDALAESIAPAEAQMRELASQIKTLQQGETGDEAFELDRQIGALTRLVNPPMPRAVEAEAKPE